MRTIRPHSDVVGMHSTPSGNWQSSGHVLQSSPHRSSHTPFPQHGPQSCAQLQQVSPALAVQQPSPHSWQSCGQLLHVSQAGSQVPSPHADWHTPPTEHLSHGSHRQSPTHVRQFSKHRGWQTPFPQSGSHAPVAVLHVVHSPHPQSSSHVTQFSHAGSHVPSPQSETHSKRQLRPTVQISSQCVQGGHSQS